MAPTKGAIFCLVAGARYTNYMQIDLEPFPLAIHPTNYGQS